MENSPDEGELSASGKQTMHRRPPLQAVAVRLIEVGLAQDRVVVVRPVLPDERRYAARPPGPKGSGARLGEADEAPWAVERRKSSEHGREA